MFEPWIEEEADFWDRFEVDFRDLPTLQSLLVCCDKKMLLEIIKREYLEGRSRRAVGSEVRTDRVISDALRDMCVMDLGELSQQGDWILLPLEEFEVLPDSHAVARHVAAPRTLLRSKDDSHAWGTRIDCSYRDVPWEKVLSYRVWMGGSLCTQERYMMLASAVWDMVRTSLDEKLTGPIPDIAKVEERFTIPFVDDPWGLSVSRDFEERYRDSLQAMVDWLNEKAWERFFEERTFFADVVLKSA